MAETLLLNSAVFYKPSFFGFEGDAKDYEKSF